MSSGASRTRIAAAAALSATAVGVPASVAASTYVVRPGDNIAEIAVRHATTVEALAQANDLDAVAQLRPGSMLRIPDASLGLPAYVSQSHDIELYTVAPGDQLFGVARYFGIDATALARSNGIGVDDNLEPGAVLQVPGRLGRVNALLTHVSGHVGVDPDVVRAVAWMESGWQQDVISATGAVGLMQLEPYTGEWVSQFLADEKLDIHIAKDNVMAGSLLLNHLVSLHGGDTQSALAAYYQGAASIAQRGLFEDTRQYVNVVNDLLAAA